MQYVLSMNASSGHAEIVIDIYFPFIFTQLSEKKLNIPSIRTWFDWNCDQLGSADSKKLIFE